MSESFCALALPPAVMGTSFGVGIIIYTITSAPGGGLMRIEVGRSTFRYPANPSLLPCFSTSARYIVIPEAPFYVNMSALMGITRYDSGAGCRPARCLPPSRAHASSPPPFRALLPI